MKYVEGPYEIKLCYCVKKQGPKRKIGFLIFYLPHFSLKKFLDPFISQKKNSSDYRLHGTQNDRLELTKPAYFETFWPISQDSVHIFQNRFLRWNRGLKPVILSTMKPIIGGIIFLTYKGVQKFFKWKMG